MLAHIVQHIGFEITQLILHNKYTVYIQYGSFNFLDEGSTIGHLHSGPVGSTNMVTVVALTVT